MFAPTTKTRKVLLVTAMVAMIGFPTVATFTPSLKLPTRPLVNPTSRASGADIRCAAGTGGEGAAVRHPSRRSSLLKFGLATVGAMMGSKVEALEIEEYKLMQIFKEAQDLGIVRFITVSPYGAVQESLGRLDYEYVPFELRSGKMAGQWVRFAGPKSSEKYVASFETSINIDRASKLYFDTLDGPHGPLYTMRIVDEDGNKMISILLNYDIEGNGGKPGQYYAGAVEKWEKLRKKYGQQVTLFE